MTERLEGFPCCTICGSSHITENHKCGYCSSPDHVGKVCPHITKLCRFCHKVKHTDICDERLQDDARREKNRCQDCGRKGGSMPSIKCLTCSCKICRKPFHDTSEHSCRVCRRFGVNHTEKNCPLNKVIF